MPQPDSVAASARATGSASRRAEERFTNGSVAASGRAFSRWHPGVGAGHEQHDVEHGDQRHEHEGEPRRRPAPPEADGEQHHGGADGDPAARPRRTWRGEWRAPGSRARARRPPGPGSRPARAGPAGRRRPARSASMSGSALAAWAPRPSRAPATQPHQGGAGRPGRLSTTKAGSAPNAST